MDEANEIDLVFRRYGGAFDYESVPYIGGLDALRDRLQSFSSSVMCAHINNPSFNAVAMLRGDKEYIGIFHGFSCLVVYVYLAMMADPVAFPGIGITSTEDAPANISPLKNLKSGGFLNNPPRTPKCRVRAEAAKHMIYISHLFLYFHEFTHLELCHVHFLREHFQTDAYEELTTLSLSEEEEDIRHAFELQADQCGALNSLQIWRLHWAHNVSEKYSLKADSLWAAAIDTLFVLFQYIRSVTGKKLSLTHPNLAIRWLSVRLSTDVFSGDVEHLEHDLIFRRQALDWFETHLPEGLKLSTKADADGALDETTRIWSNLKPHWSTLQKLQERRGGRAYEFPQRDDDK